MIASGLILGEAGTAVLLSVFLLFCRIGACLMIIPGFASDRVAMRIRLFIALSVTLALTPLLLPTMEAALPDQTLATTARLIASELFIGFLIGFLGRIFLVALETLATFVSMAVGLSNMQGVAIEGNQALPPLANLMTLTATAMIFISNQHWEVLRGLAASYKALPPGGPMDVVGALERLSDQLDTTFVLALRICSPFVVYTVVVNLTIGLVNKLTPQIPVYFISMPFVIAGGMYFLFLVFSEAITLFLDGYFTWLKLG
ncbi:flagellar biosynthesis protein FliR [Roseibium aggregatum]|uniref:Flagellar biosynthesis protein FliR n=1 Tax=Roseibium aggregatum TaxID=187304 RepID=A0A926NSM5_9HYPH|nr:flagellar biosynthesis protein FliR [Roseibium aggregatum]MBD1545704.1 flagellar biosynthesis protein FliR [Roseibium aggregatum]